MSRERHSEIRIETGSLRDRQTRDLRLISSEPVGEWTDLNWVASRVRK